MKITSALKKYQQQPFNTEGTAKVHQSQADDFVTWCNTSGLVDVDDLSRVDIYDYMSMVANAYPNTTAASKYYVVSSFCEYLVDRELKDQNLTESYSLAKWNIDPTRTAKVDALDTNDPIIAIPPHEVELLWDNVNQPKLRNELVIKLMWQTGVRAHELCNIKLDDPEPVAGRPLSKVHIYSEKTYNDRDVYYHKNLDLLVDQWLIDRKSYSISHDSEYLFISKKLPQMRTQHVNDIVKDAAHNAGIQEKLYTDAAGNTRWKITSHTIRHSYATHAANERKMPVHQLSRLMGHKNIETTMKYISPDTAALERAVVEHGPR